MRQATPALEHGRAPSEARAAGRPLVVWGPVFGLGLIVLTAAILAGLTGWHRIWMFAAAAVLSTGLLLSAITLLYRQDTAQRQAQRALDQVETRVGEILNSAMDAIITVDHQQRIVLFNNAAEQVFGWPRNAVLSQSLDVLLPARFRDTHARHIHQFGKTGVTSRRMGANTVLTGLRATGDEFPVEASISQFGEGADKLYTVILRDVTLRVKADEAVRRSREELLEFATAANQLREQEKRRIARELHDELAQALTGLKMDVAWIKNKMPEPAAPIGDKLTAMETLLDSTVAATRRISSDLRPMMLDDLGLVPAVEWLTQSFAERTGIRCKLAVSDLDIELHDPHATTIYRVLQESLTNVAKHARAASVDVRLQRVGGQCVLTVRDDGAGFSADSARKPNSYGLIGMRERVYLLAGQVEIHSTPGAGTRVVMRLPLTESVS